DDGQLGSPGGRRRGARGSRKHLAPGRHQGERSGVDNRQPDDGRSPVVDLDSIASPRRSQTMQMRNYGRALIMVVIIALSAGDLTGQADSVFTATFAGTSLLRLNADGALVVRGTEGIGLLPATGAGVRMMWYP